MYTEGFHPVQRDCSIPTFYPQLVGVWEGLTERFPSRPAGLFYSYYLFLPNGGLGEILVSIPSSGIVLFLPAYLHGSPELPMVTYVIVSIVSIPSSGIVLFLPGPL